MKATTTLRRAVCIAAASLALTAAAGCRGAQYVEVGTKYADDAARGGTKAGRQGERNGPTPGDVKEGVDKACKVGDKIGDSDDSPCW